MEIIYKLLVILMLVYLVLSQIQLKRRLKLMAHTLTELLDKLRAETTLIGSLKTLIVTLRQDVKAAKGDQAQIDAAFDLAQQNAADITAAALENTPEGSSGTGGDTSGTGNV